MTDLLILTTKTFIFWGGLGYITSHSPQCTPGLEDIMYYMKYTFI
uniref:Uncharacterized protein n=1 Tax=Anguilla anguilla TaxID=7936 RepID=A0A0E9XJ21_ANGAN